MVKKILLISTEPGLHSTIINTLDGAGYTVIAMTFYGNILSIIREEMPQCVVIDADQTSPEGFELSQKMKEDTETATIPVILILDLIDEHLIKPVEPELIQAKVQKLIGKSSEVRGERTVVIIDDEIDLCEMLVLRFENWGFQATVAHDGKEGVQLIKRELPDLVILDLHLPGLSGEEVCKKIREDDTTEDIPIIMLTAKSTEVDRIIGKVIGANEYITKPFEIDEFYEKVKGVTEGR